MKAITGATLIDGRGGPPLSNATALLDEGRIVAVGASGDVAVPEGADVVQAGGLTLLPGLIDCHDHLANFGYEVASRWGLNETNALRAMRVASVLRQTLESGYTTIRDAGGLSAGYRDAVDEGLVPARAYRSRSTSSRPPAASATTPARPATPIPLRQTRHCRPASPTAQPRCAPGYARWSAWARTLSRRPPPAARARGQVLAPGICS